jgi:UDP-N-acetylglucosamine/UDP-N-acetylgalactosamine diphosphorylase
VSFLEKTTEILAENPLPYHIAKKKIPCIDLETGEKLQPSKPNGIKLEQFIFDIFPFINDMGILEVERQAEFSPLKNGSGPDSPETTKRDLMRECARYLAEAGASVEKGAICEISPLISYSGEGLEPFNGRSLASPVLL